MLLHRALGRRTPERCNCQLDLLHLPASANAIRLAGFASTNPLVSAVTSGQKGP